MCLFIFHLFGESSHDPGSGLDGGFFSLNQMESNSLPIVPRRKRGEEK